MISSKIQLSIILIVTLLLVGCNNGQKVSPVKNFAIYLVKDLTTTEAMGKNLADLLLESTPLLTDREIKTYEWNEHVFTLKDGFNLEEKLEGKVSLSGKPFVVVVGSQRIYLGSFWTPISSLYIPAIPTIDSIWSKTINKDSYAIKCENKKDPRADKRIYESLKEAGKIVD